MRTLIRVGLALLLVALVSVAAFIFGGRYDVAASTPEWSALRWLFATARDKSIDVQSERVSLRAPDMNAARAGAREFDGMCVQCHGGPGRERSVVGKGLNPSPPDLTDASLQLRYNDAELFWIVKHGIKMSGMPAFGETHDDDTIWSIVSFVRRLPDLDPEEYQAWMAGGPSTVAKAPGAR